jgi:hypothetical protein
MFSKRTPKKFKALEPFAAQVRKPEVALADIRNGDHVFIGTGCAAPHTLLQALGSLSVVPADLEMLHFFTVNAFDKDDEGQITRRFKHRVFFVGTDMLGAVKQGLVEYVPISAARVPEMIERGRIRVDVALIQVSLPDEFGYVSLGVSVDMIPAAVARARLVIAEVNPAMPRSMGDSTLHVSRIHHLVPVDVPVTELGREPAQEETVQRIARYIAGIIEDGSTLQVGLSKPGPRSAAVRHRPQGPGHPLRGHLRRDPAAAGARQPERRAQDQPAVQDRHQHGAGLARALRPDRPQPAVRVPADRRRSAIRPPSPRSTRWCRSARPMPST